LSSSNRSTNKKSSSNNSRWLSYYNNSKKELLSISRNKWKKKNKKSSYSSSIWWNSKKRNLTYWKNRTDRVYKWYRTSWRVLRVRMIRLAIERSRRWWQEYCWWNRICYSCQWWSGYLWVSILGGKWWRVDKEDGRVEEEWYRVNDWLVILFIWLISDDV